jgi:multimeric flavodoxin WrbA/nitrite reductase/ring-hydroxylating ferredoxin subunit
MSETTWVDVGDAAELSTRPLQEVIVGKRPIALSCVDGRWGAISGVCNHVGGPLGRGRLEGELVVCPWHAWRFHRVEGHGEPGFEEDRVPRHEVRVECGRVLVSAEPVTRRAKRPHAKHPLEVVLHRGDPGGPPADAPWRVLGISCTSMNPRNPRFSTSDHLLQAALDHAHADGAETRLVRLSDLKFRSCEGYYSIHERACTWPCSITQMDPTDQLDQVYEGIVQWADVILVATPIRWGAAGSLFFRMAERLNCVQNQVTLSDRVMMKNKVAGLIITGGQDNIQAVAGHMLNFFGELGCHFPQFPYVAHSRGWSAEDMENNVNMVRASEALREGAESLVDRCLALSEALIGHQLGHDRVPRGGRKGSALGRHG